MENTILLRKIEYRAVTSTISKTMRRKIMEKFRAFIWKGKKAKVRWGVLVEKTEEGGVGLRDPMCVIDAGKIRTLINLITKDRQPWMRWVRRKLKRVTRKWKVRR